MTTIEPMVKSLVAEFSTAWNNSNGSAGLGPSVSGEEHSRNERRLLEFISEVKQELVQQPSSFDENSALQMRMLGRLGKLGRETFGLSPQQAEVLLGTGMPQALKGFLVRARQMDCFSDADILQSSRNAGVANVIQLMLGKAPEITPAVFGYSLLYPATDNYLDDPAVSTAAKREFNARFGRRLAGEPVVPTSEREALVYGLVKMIEDRIDRAGEPVVYEGLRAIHRAQVRFLDISAAHLSGQKEVLEGSIEKGGTSVLADGYLAAEGDLSMGQVKFLFGLGTFLQFVDDLQDLKSDLKNGNVSVATQSASEPAVLESLTSRAISFGYYVMGLADAFPSSGGALKTIFLGSVPSLIIASASYNQEFYKEKYFRNLESHFPFGFEFLKEVRLKLERQDISFSRLLDTVVGG